MQNLVEEKDKKVKELQDNIAAVSFTPSSKMGKMLMAKCRTLQEENEEIGNQAAEGKVWPLINFVAILNLYFDHVTWHSYFHFLTILLLYLEIYIYRSGLMKFCSLCVCDQSRLPFDCRCMN